MIDASLPRFVQMQLLRPAELENRLRTFPVVYVPMGLIEWHGSHLPLGNDALKAHAILVKTAEKFGGVVYPPIYFHDGFSRDHMLHILSYLFRQLRATGVRVIIPVSGHNVQCQIDLANEALAPLIKEGKIAGEAYWEMTLSLCEESNSDHAAKWETSNMMFFYPDCVDMATLGNAPINLDMKPPSGIGGLDPRIHASAEVGRQNAGLCAEALGKRARELLMSLDANEREFDLPAISPEHWWMI